MPVSFDPDKLIENVRREVARAVIQATELVRNEAVRLVLSTPKSGRVYGGRRRPHQASAPGEPWASNTGYALSTIKTSYDDRSMTGRVAINAAYGRYLEFGTQSMEPRPVLRPALANMQSQIDALVNAAVKKALG